jgi:hypothetical protein
VSCPTRSCRTGAVEVVSATMRTVLVAVIALTLTAGPAHAEPPASVSVPGDFPHPSAARLVIRETLTVGEGAWHARAVQPCAAPNVLVVASIAAGDGDGMADLNGCRIWLRAGLVRAAARERPRANTGGDSQRELLCQTVMHELGHTAGLEHTRSGVMSPDVGEVPWACREWRATLDRAYLSSRPHRCAARSRRRSRSRRSVRGWRPASRTCCRAGSSRTRRHGCTAFR